MSLEPKHNKNTTVEEREKRISSAIGAVAFAAFAIYSYSQPSMEEQAELNNRDLQIINEGVQAKNLPPGAEIAKPMVDTPANRKKVCLQIVKVASGDKFCIPKIHPENQLLLVKPT